MTERGNPENSFLIVGIGASAGGLEPLQRFLSAVPKDFDYALVFIQHLSSKHKSLLPELLASRIPSLAIQEISDGLKALPGRLYLCPPGKEVRIRDGFFSLTVHQEGLISFLVALWLGVKIGLIYSWRLGRWHLILI